MAFGSRPITVEDDPETSIGEMYMMISYEGESVNHLIEVGSFRSEPVQTSSNISRDRRTVNCWFGSASANFRTRTRTAGLVRSVQL